MGRREGVKERRGCVVGVCVCVCVCAVRAVCVRARVFCVTPLPQSMWELLFPFGTNWRIVYVCVLCRAMCWVDSLLATCT